MQYGTGGVWDSDGSKVAARWMRAVRYGRGSSLSSVCYGLMACVWYESRQYTQAQVTIGQHNVAECTQNIKNNILTSISTQELRSCIMPSSMSSESVSFRRLFVLARTTACLLTVLSQHHSLQEVQHHVHTRTLLNRNAWLHMRSTHAPKKKNHWASMASLSRSPTRLRYCSFAVASVAALRIHAPV